MVEAHSAAQLIDWAARRFEGAELCFGHGADDPSSEAAALVFEALELPLGATSEQLDAPLAPAARARIADLVAERIATRRPRAYLTGRCWFAGCCFEIDERVLVPRSPIAELIEDRFAPWLDGAAVEQVLDVGTGSGCIGLAVAVHLDWTRVDLVDVSPAALEVAQANIQRLGVAGRARAVQSDLFSGVAGKRYDLIVSNPPYVPGGDLGELPPEYAFEPKTGLAAGADGLHFIRRIIDQASAHLTATGHLIAEVGGGREALERAYPRLPFTWPDLTRGGEGVFILSRADLCWPG